MKSHSRSILTIILIAILVCAGTVSTRAAEKSSAYQAAFESIKTEDLSWHVNRLAGDDMEGREAGRKGGHAAAEYLAKRYEKLKLRGAGSDGGFFQPFSRNFRNVLAMIEGGDPKLRDQVIVVCAHYDHLGYGGPASLGRYGLIHPGADDNASGTAAVLELAEAMTFLTSPLKRSIIFANWDAEEKGLLGSRHWVSHVTIPLENVKAAINLDMVGRVRDDRLTIYGSRSGQGFRRLFCLHNDEAGLHLLFPWGIKPNADHYPFFNRGVPAVMLNTGLHDEYHRPSDKAELINSVGMTRVTRLLFSVVYELADNPASLPDYRADARYETRFDERVASKQVVKPADRLGVSWNGDTKKNGGVRISRIFDSSPALNAGLRPGDLITRFDGRDIRADEDFFAAVSSAANPVAMTVNRPDEDKPLELTVQLTGVPLRWGITWQLDDAEPGMVVLSHVIPGSPAARAGLSAGDRIYRVTGRDFKDEDDFVRLVGTRDATMQLLVERDGRMRIVTLRLNRNKPLKRAA